MSNEREERIKTVMQVIGILCMAGLLSMIFHKGFVDISALWHRHSAGDFWPALLLYFFRNMAG